MRVLQQTWNCMMNVLFVKIQNLYCIGFAPYHVVQNSNGKMVEYQNTWRVGSINWRKQQSVKLHDASSSLARPSKITWSVRLTGKTLGWLPSNQGSSPWPTTKKIWWCRLTGIGCQTFNLEDASSNLVTITKIIRTRSIMAMQETFNLLTDRFDSFRVLQDMGLWLNGKALRLHRSFCRFESCRLHQNNAEVAQSGRA